MILDKILKGLGSNFLSIDHGFIFGSQGLLLRRNLEELWYRNCVVMPPYNVFLSQNEKFNDTIHCLRSHDVADKPLGIASFENSKHILNPDIVSCYPKLNSHRTAKVSIITDSTDGKDLYHKKQRERKVWWRKHSREPSRFKFTEIKKINKNKDSIDISAEFSFGSIVVETIVYHQDMRKIGCQMETDETISTQLVEHTTSIDWGCLAFLCDAYSPPPASSSLGQLKLHPKLSPYKIGFYIESSNEESDSKTQEKSRLSLYLNNQLKLKGVETVVTKSRESVEALQVPLIVIVNDMSLQNGIVQVWSQLTTLSESVHMTELPKYVMIRCNV